MNNCLILLIREHRNSWKLKMFSPLHTAFLKSRLRKLSNVAEAIRCMGMESRLPGGYLPFHGLALAPFCKLRMA